MIDDFCWSQSIDLFLKNMAKAFFRVRELFLHSLTLIQALDDFRRGEDLVGLLRGDIVEDVLDTLFIKVIRQLFLEPKEFLHRVIEYDRVKEIARKLLFLPCLSVLVFTAVTEEPELVKGDACHLKEHRIRDNGIEGCQRNGIIAIGHQE